MTFSILKSKILLKIKHKSIKFFKKQVIKSISNESKFQIQMNLCLKKTYNVQRFGKTGDRRTHTLYVEVSVRQLVLIFQINS